MKLTAIKREKPKVCSMFKILIVVEKNIYKMQHLKGSGTLVLHIGRMILKG
jgi:hypothetical protein